MTFRAAVFCQTLLMCVALAPATMAETRAPNILFIFADDVGQVPVSSRERCVKIPWATTGRTFINEV